MLMGGLGRFPWKQTNIRGVYSLNEVGEDYQGKAGVSSKAHTCMHCVPIFFFVRRTKIWGGGGRGSRYG